MNDVKQRAKNAMLGLAIGDAISWTSMFHRSVLLPHWTRRIRREIDTSSETTNVLLTPMPFSLNQPAEYFNISPTDKTEWAAFSAEILLKSNNESYEQNIYSEWLKLVNSPDQIRGYVSTQAAITNLRSGLKPPQTGKQNPHYFDDGAMSRAVPIGIICAGLPAEAAHLAEIDASVTNSEDGVWAAQSIAVTISLVCAGESVIDATNAAYQYLPESSWIKRIVDQVMFITEKCDSVFSILPELQNRIINREYSYGNVAPETLAIALLIAKYHGDDFEKAISTSACFAKSGETLPALVGALVGAKQSHNIANGFWLASIEKLKGISIPHFVEKNYLNIVEDLSNQAGQRK
ncbi:MAG: ADP-ribosylglycohydrolase family protein [Ignavibacterium sp.]|jgi:ADP-ribosylglycohydrolase|nr:ADP-ribosylglycohydrolase family protein [Ignavibacterium sp.]